MAECADPIKNVLRSVLIKIHQIFKESHQDDTEYVRNVKAVLNGFDAFAQDNKEVVRDPDSVRQWLYQFSKEQWLENVATARKKDAASQDDYPTSADDGYHDYYYDYIFNHGVYPR